MNNFKKNLNSAFYVILLISLIIYAIPGKYKIAVYGLNFLGWTTAIFIVVTFILFLWLLILDLKNKQFKVLFKRVIVFLLALMLCVVAAHFELKK